MSGISLLKSGRKILILMMGMVQQRKLIKKTIQQRKESLKIQIIIIQLKEEIKQQIYLLKKIMGKNLKPNQKVKKKGKNVKKK